MFIDIHKIIETYQKYLLNKAQDFSEYSLLSSFHVTKRLFSFHHTKTAYQFLFLQNYG